MIVAGVVIGLGVVTGVAVTAGAWRWSRRDPTDPHLERSTVRRILREHPLVKRLVRRHHPKPTAATAEALGSHRCVGGDRQRHGRRDPADDQDAHAASPVSTRRSPTGRPNSATEASTEVMRAISEFGGTAYVVLAALAVIGIEMLRDRRWTIPMFVAATIGGQFLLSNSIKWIVDRARPTISPLTGFAGTSFPSGHAVAAAATWACVAFLLGRRRHRHARAVLLGGAAAIAVAVAATRVALGVHWTTDVVAGLLAGLDVVRAVRDRVRWPSAALRRSGRGHRRRGEPVGRSRDGRKTTLGASPPRSGRRHESAPLSRSRGAEMTQKRP